mmetsp:Transcript_78802/g.168859  ORF Transcript_78802/g.168859 Transcript_78802/m.168859 type:complete len:247 (+) Transcript_78802:535-1275(+)
MRCAPGGAPSVRIGNKARLSPPGKRTPNWPSVPRPQAQTVPSTARTNEWSAPQAACEAKGTGIATGREASRSQPVPSCPSELRPKAQTAPVVVTKRLWSPPQATMETGTGKGTGVGSGWKRSAGEPRPSCPEAAAPQLYATPPRTATECCKPAARPRVRANADTSARRSMNSSARKLGSSRWLCRCCTQISAGSAPKTSRQTQSANSSLAVARAAWLTMKRPISRGRNQEAARKTNCCGSQASCTV